jgi:hypothetical protein
MRKWLMSGIAGTVLALFAMAPIGVSAATASGSPGQGLEISPPVIELSANPGQSVSTNISVRNVTAGELVATATTNDFGASSDESGTPKLLLTETGATRYSLRYWVTGVNGLDLAAGELKTTKVVINVPANAEPGGHYGVVRFTGVPPDMKQTGVALSASVGALILLTVNGDITHQANVEQFSTGTQNVKTAEFSVSGFFEHGPVDFLVRIKNSGSVHEQATGIITVKNMFGGKVATVAVNSLGGNVLPDSIRRFTQTLANKQLFGLYTAKLSMTYAGNKTLAANASFWVIPWKLVLLVLLGLLVIGYLLKVGIRKYNQHIIAMARRR